MTIAFSHPDPAIAYLVHHAIENEGIEAIVRNEALGAALGEVPPIAAWVEVWVADDDRLADAVRIARASMTDAAPTAPWTCPSCGETLEGQFHACWQCGEPRPAVEA